MQRTFRLVLAVLGVSIIFAGLQVLAQQSASYRIESGTFNAGGRPEGGQTASSASFEVSLDAIGDAVVVADAASASFGMDGSFVRTYRPPGEVQQLVFEDSQTLRWAPEPSTGTFNLYREAIATLPGLAFGACQQQAISTNSTTDGASPGASAGFFYLVTAVNRIDEEGSKGAQSDNTQRLGSVCP